LIIYHDVIVVYKINCIDCDTRNVGQTKKQLKIKIRDINISDLTKK